MIDTIYHTGLLAVDRRFDPRLDKRAKELLKLAENGKVTLVQRRVATDVYEYRCRPIKGA
jgi:hypothetical protein